MISLFCRKSFSPGEKHHFRPGGKPKPPQTDRSSPCLKLHLKGPWQHFHLASLPSQPSISPLLLQPFKPPETTLYFPPKKKKTNILIPFLNGTGPICYFLGTLAYNIAYLAWRYISCKLRTCAKTSVFF